MNAIAPITALPARLATAQVQTPIERIQRWIERLSPNTARGYLRDLVTFSAWMLELDDMPPVSKAWPHVERALASMCDATPSAALTILEDWQADQQAADLAAATINRRISAVNAALRELHKADVGPGRLDVRVLKPEPKKIISAPKIGAVQQTLDALKQRGTPGAVRDRAILLLAAQRGLRRSEIAGLTLNDLHLDDCQVAVRRKGKKRKIRIDLAATTCAVLKEWIAIRDDFAGDGEMGVFVAVGNRHRGVTLGDRAIYDIIRRIGGGDWHPHALRHTAITETLARNQNSIAVAQEFAGHAGSATTMRYVRDKERLAKAGVDSMADVFAV